MTSRPQPNRLISTGEQSQYQMYSKFINDILKFIRKGDKDFAYYIYQIEDLLRFEPELKTKYIRDGQGFSYFEVWI